MYLCLGKEASEDTSKSYDFVISLNEVVAIPPLLNLWTKCNVDSFYML